MHNFLDFISNDVEVKKTFLSSLPTKTKTNIKKYNAEYYSKTDEYTHVFDVGDLLFGETLLGLVLPVDDAAHVVAAVADTLNFRNLT